MNELPVSVRLALWVTHAWKSGDDVGAAVEAATPDADAVIVDVGWLTALGAMGEHMLLVALPSPGRTSSLPQASASTTAAVLAAGECCYAPTLGGLLVPTVADYGSADDRGLRVDLDTYECSPRPAHLVDMIDGAEADRRLRTAMMETTDELTRSAPALLGQAGRLEAESGDSQWAVPPGLPGRELERLVRAATTERIARVGMRTTWGRLTSDAVARAESPISRLHALACDTLAEVTNATVLAMIGRQR